MPIVDNAPALGSVVLALLRDFYADPKNVAGFEEWKKERVQHDAD